MSFINDKTMNKVKLDSLKIKEFTLANENELIKHRRWFHQHPETSYKEIKTSSYIINFLKSIGVTNIKTIAETGVIAEIGTKGETFACRFNMDGLAIKEETNLTYSSLFEGFSHACGHDFELAWGLMIAKYYQENKPDNILRLIFQPAEEGPGAEEKGRTGGQYLADEGCFDVAGIYSFHVEPKYDTGIVSITEGEVTANAYDFEILLQGRMAHAAKPDEGLNPIYIIPYVIQGIESLNVEINKKLDSDEFAIISPTDIRTTLGNIEKNQDDAINTIPEYVVVKGITRFRSNIAGEMILNGLSEITKSSKMKLIDASINLQRRAFATINDEYLVLTVKKSIEDCTYDIVESRTTWRDDAGWASAKAPTAHGFIGVKNEISTNLHSPSFNPSENGLKVGLNVFLLSLSQNLFLR